MQNIVVVPYDPKWPQEFQRIRNEVAQVLGESALAVEHVGSTSVPGLWAKPIIDIDIVIEECSFDIVKDQLQRIGYAHVGDLGIEGREAFTYENKGHLMAHHLYVCHKNAHELKRHLTFRDFLRSNKGYRDKYSAVKVEAAKQHPREIDKYLDSKQPFILEVYKLCGLDISYKDDYV